MSIKKLLSLTSLSLVLAYGGQGQPGLELRSCDTYAWVDFTSSLREWDGFGVNYVEVAQTYDYDHHPQDYGGFSVLDESSRQEIIELIFGDDGLRPGLAKMFLDPLHQQELSSPKDHETTTRWMRYFIRQGLQKTRARGDDLSIITTLYGPPGWAKIQRHIGGRDPDPTRFDELGDFIVDWAKYLKENDYPLKYVSIHNEAEYQYSWNIEDGNTFHGIDYDAYWKPEQVANFMILLDDKLKKNGLSELKVTPGETKDWRVFRWANYDWAIVNNKEALNRMGLITSHSFGPMSSVTSAPIDLLRSRRPGLHAWVASCSWGKIDMHFTEQVINNIYKAKVNGIIPWAICQRPSQWKNGDPNPEAPIQVNDDGTFDISSNYYVYKQYTRAGQPGKVICPVASTEGSGVNLVAFGSNGTGEPDAFVLVNRNDWSVKKMAVKVLGSAQRFKAIRTVRKYGYKLTEAYEHIGEYELKDGYLLYTAPGHSITTFYAINE